MQVSGMKKKFLVHFLDGICRDGISAAFKELVSLEISAMVKEVMEDESLSNFLPSLYRIVSDWNNRDLFVNLASIIEEMKSKGIE